jgi:hypothetical protein
MCVTDAGFEIADIIVDCWDPERVASLSAELLGRPIEGRKGPYVWLARRGGQREWASSGSRSRRSARTACTSTWRSPMSSTGKCGSKVSEVDGSKATRARGFLVMADPEGNEFCLIPVASFEFDDEGRADYLDGLDV